MSNIRYIVEKICQIRQEVPVQRSVLVAISGIDGCGKGYIAAKILDALKSEKLNAVIINGDGWLNLPNRRFNYDRPAPKETINAYRTIYFPAQEIHFQRDNPQSLAAVIINNDTNMTQIKGKYANLSEIEFAQKVFCDGK